MVIADGRLTVLGESGLIHVDAGRLTGKRARTELAGLKLSYLDRGDSLDLATFGRSPGRPSGGSTPASATSAPPPASASPPSPATPPTRPWRGWSRATPWSIAARPPGPTSTRRGNEIAVEISRGRRAKALLEHTDQGVRVTALGFDLRCASGRRAVRSTTATAPWAAAAEPAGGRLVLLGSPLRAGTLCWPSCASSSPSPWA